MNKDRPPQNHQPKPDDNKSQSVIRATRRLQVGDDW